MSTVRNERWPVRTVNATAGAVRSWREISPWWVLAVAIPPGFGGFLAVLTALSGDDWTVGFVLGVLISGVFEFMASIPLWAE